MCEKCQRFFALSWTVMVMVVVKKVIGCERKSSEGGLDFSVWPRCKAKLLLSILLRRRTLLLFAQQQHHQLLWVSPHGGVAAAVFAVLFPLRASPSSYKTKSRSVVAPPPPPRRQRSIAADGERRREELPVSPSLEHKQHLLGNILQNWQLQIFNQWNISFSFQCFVGVDSK